MLLLRLLLSVSHLFTICLFVSFSTELYIAGGWVFMQVPAQGRSLRTDDAISVWSLILTRTIAGHCVRPFESAVTHDGLETYRTFWNLLQPLQCGMSLRFLSFLFFDLLV